MLLISSGKRRSKRLDRGRCPGHPRQPRVPAAPAPAPPAWHSRIRSGRQPSSRPPHCTAARRHAEAVRSSSLQDLRQHQLQRRRDPRQPLLDHRLADPFARDRLRARPRDRWSNSAAICCSFSAPSAARSTSSNSEPSSSSAATSAPKRRAEQQPLAADLEAGFAAIGIGAGSQRHHFARSFRAPACNCARR